MLDCDPKNLKEEVRAAFERTHAATCDLPEQIRVMHGKHYRRGSEPSAEHLENRALEYMRLVSPQIAFSNPAYRVTTTADGVAAQLGQAHHYAVNKWARDLRLNEIVQELVDWACFKYGVAMTIVEPTPAWWAHGVPAHRPRVEVIEPWNFAWDPAAKRMGSARYHIVRSRRDRDDILNADAGWITEQVNRIPASKSQAKELHAIERDEIDVFEVIVYGKVLDEHKRPGVSATIYTFAGVSTAEEAHSQNTASIGELHEIRKPRPYWGPAWGPITVLGFLRVPGQAGPLGPISASWANTVEENAVDQSYATAVKNYKNLFVYDNSLEDVAAKLTQAPHMSAVGVQGFERAKAGTFTHGGPTEFHAAYLAHVRARNDRGLGVNDQLRAVLGQSDSATESTLAAAANDVTLDTMRRETYLAAERIGRTAMWYMFHMETVNFPLGGEAARELGRAKPHFYGGVGPKIGLPFEALDMMIEAYSMERTNEARRQAAILQAINLMSSMAVLPQQAPYFAYGEIFQALGEASGLPELGRWFSPQVAAALAANGIVMQQAAGGQAQPRLSGDSVGPKPITTPQQRAQRRDAGQAGGRQGMVGYKTGAALGARTKASKGGGD